MNNQAAVELGRLGGKAGKGRAKSVEHREKLRSSLRGVWGRMRSGVEGGERDAIPAKPALSASVPFPAIATMEVPVCTLCGQPAKKFKRNGLTLTLCPAHDPR